MGIFKPAEFHSLYYTLAADRHVHCCLLGPSTYLRFTAIKLTLSSYYTSAILGAQNSLNGTQLKLAHVQK